MHLVAIVQRGNDQQNLNIDNTQYDRTVWHRIDARTNSFVHALNGWLEFRAIIAAQGGGQKDYHFINMQT